MGKHHRESQEVIFTSTYLLISHSVKRKIFLGRSVGGGPMRSRSRNIDTSPYSSNNTAYLSPPESSWRRTSSDSAIHQSLAQAQVSVKKVYCCIAERFNCIKTSFRTFTTTFIIHWCLVRVLKSDCRVVKVTAWKISITSNSIAQQWANNTVIVNRICNNRRLINSRLSTSTNSRQWTNSIWWWTIYNKTWNHDQFQGCQELSKKSHKTFIVSYLFNLPFCFLSSVYPSQNDDTLQIPIGNSTGSLPDLTLVHYQQSPLSTPLDLEHDHQLITVSSSSFNTVSDNPLNHHQLLTKRFSLISLELVLLNANGDEHKSNFIVKSTATKHEPTSNISSDGSANSDKQSRRLQSEAF